MKTDWKKLLDDRRAEEEKDAAFKRFVRDRLTWYAIAAVVFAAFIYFAV